MSKIVFYTILLVFLRFRLFKEKIIFLDLGGQYSQTGCFCGSKSHNHLLFQKLNFKHLILRNICGNEVCHAKKTFLFAPECARPGTLKVVESILDRRHQNQNRKGKTCIH